MADTVKQTEGVPEAYPDAGVTLSTAAAALSEAMLWQRLEAYTAYRWSERDVEWIVDGPGGWEPPLSPAEIATVEVWQGGTWQSATIAASPLGGYCLNAQEAAQARERDRREADRLEQEQAQKRERHRQRAQAERRNNEEAVQELRADVEQLAPEPQRDVQQARDGPDRHVRPPEHERPKAEIPRQEPLRAAPQPKAPANLEPEEPPQSYAEKQRARASEARQDRSYDWPGLER